MLKHIENNECRYGWTIQHLNALAEECNELAYFIIPERILWFRAGAPPLKPEQTDYSPYDDLYVCPVCDEEYERGHQLREHLKGRECSYDYPSVLRCPWCPNAGFERLSQLFEHLERPGCRSDRRLVASLIECLRRTFEDPRVQQSVQQRLERDSIRLQADKGRGILRLVQEFYDDDLF